MAKILIVEDNQGTNKAICEYMKEAGHTLFSAFTGSEALKIFREKELDIIVLDIMLPEMSGIVVLHEIRKISNIPVIMLTALDDEYTQSNSFDEMADDYITKPFSMLILGKRITALLRRSQNKPAVNTVKLGDITVDFSGYTASDENGKIDITPKELEILKVLIDNKGLVLSRNQILDEVWGYDCDVIDRTIDAYIRNIRKKLRLDCITTVKGIGVADGLFCREIDGLFCRSSPDIIVRRRCVLSHKRRGWLQPSPSFRYSRNLALQDELYHPVINNGPAVLVCVDKRLGTGPVNQSRDAG